MAHEPYFSKKIVFSLKYKDHMREEFRKMWLGPFTWTLKLGCLTNFLGKMWLGPFTWTLKLGCLTNFFRKNVAWAVYMDPKIRLFDEFFSEKCGLGRLHGP